MLNERYHLLRKLGGGGAGVSYLAEDTRTGAQVVVKRFKSELTGAARREVPREVELLQELSHPQIPKFLDFFEAEVELERLPHLVQTHVPGESLDKVLTERRFTIDEALGLMASLLEVLSWLHQRAPPIVHRDVKPGNVILREGAETVSLIDFGLATGEGARTFGHTMATGTLGYQSPEQIAGQPVPASDVYGAGVLLLEMLTRRSPAEMIAGIGVLSWKRAAEHLPPPVVELLRQMLHPEPARRLRNGGESLQATRVCREALRGVPAPVPASPAPWAPTPRPEAQPAQPADVEESERDVISWWELTGGWAKGNNLLFLLILLLLFVTPFIVAFARWEVVAILIPYPLVALPLSFRVSVRDKGDAFLLRQGLLPFPGRVNRRIRKDKVVSIKRHDEGTRSQLILHITPPSTEGMSVQQKMVSMILEGQFVLGESLPTQRARAIENFLLSRKHSSIER